MTTYRKKIWNQFVKGIREFEMIKEGDNVAVRLLNTLGFQTQKIYVDLLLAMGEDGNLYKEDLARHSSRKKKENTALEQYSKDLTALAKEGKLDAVIGRETEIQRVIQILSRRMKNNPCLVGEPGVGKTSIVEGLAQKIVEGDNNFYYNSFTYGFNCKASPINCIFLKYQLEHFSETIDKIQKNAEKLSTFLKNNVDFLIPPKIENGYEHVYHLYRIGCDTTKLNVKNFGRFRETIMKILEKEGLSTRLYQTHPVYMQHIFQQLFDKNTPYPWLFNKENIELYKENYSNSTHRCTIDVIDNTFAIGDTSAAPFYLMNDDIVDFYIEGFKKISQNIEQIVDYCNSSDEYSKPYNEIVKLSDTKGVFIE